MRHPRLQGDVRQVSSYCKFTFVFGTVSQCLRLPSATQRRCLTSIRRAQNAAGHRWLEFPKTTWGCPRHCANTQKFLRSRRGCKRPKLPTQHKPRPNEQLDMHKHERAHVKRGKAKQTHILSGVLMLLPRQRKQLFNEQRAEHRTPASCPEQNTSVVKAKQHTQESR